MRSPNHGYGPSLETLHLEPLDGGRRTRLVATSLQDPFEARDATALLAG